MTIIARDGKGAERMLGPIDRAFCDDRTPLFEADPPEGFTADAEVEVQVTGTPIITVDTGVPNKPTDIVKTLREVILHTAQYVFPALERFVPDT